MTVEAEAMAPALADGEARFRDALRAVVPPPANLPQRVAALREAERHLAAMAGHHLAAGRANKLDSAMTHTAHAILSAEAAAHALQGVVQALGALRTATHRGETALRQALGDAMHSTGVVAWPLGHHAVCAVEGSERVEVPEPDKLPARYWRHPEPEPDKAALLPALREGPVPGARLARGPRTVGIRKRQERP